MVLSVCLLDFLSSEIAGRDTREDVRWCLTKNVKEDFKSLMLSDPYTCRAPIFLCLLKMPSHATVRPSTKENSTPFIQPYCSKLQTDYAYNISVSPLFSRLLLITLCSQFARYWVQSKVAYLTAA